MKVRTLLAGLVVIALAGCSDSPTGPAEVSIDGTWSGSTSGLSVTLTISESDGTLSGSGSLVGPSESVATEMNGTRTGTSVSMTLMAQGFAPTNYTGTIEDATTISGSLSGSGFSDTEVTLSKE